MTTDISVINQGLSKLSASTISSIAPPTTNLERFLASSYPQWRDSELTKRRWLCASDYVTLTLQETLTGSVPLSKPYKYGLPNNALAAIREKGSEWQRRGRFIYSAYSTLTVLFKLRIPEANFDPLLVDVVACRVALESAEYVTQSNVKKDTAKGWYDDAVAEAGRQNAFERGSEQQSNDEHDYEGYSWINDRFGG